MTKRIKTALLMMVFSILITGCGSEMVELTPEQSAVISEYAVGLLLKYDKNYKSRLMSDKEIAAAEEKQRIIEEEARQREAQRLAQESENKKTEERSTVEEAVQNVSISEFLDMDGFSIDYQSYEITESYPGSGEGDMFFSMDAAQGAQLLVLHFNIVNQTQDVQVCDILSKSVRASVKINDGNWKNALLTMLQDDLLGYQGSIEAGSAQEAVIIIELPSDELSYVEGIIMNLKYNDGSIKIGLE